MTPLLDLFRSDEAEPPSWLSYEDHVVLVDVTKRFDEETILDGVSLRVQRGEVVVIVGASGSGKSTLARIVAGLEPVTSGRVYLEGDDVTDDGPRAEPRERCGIVFQHAALLDSLPVWDNVAFPFVEGAAAVDRSEATERVRAALRAVDLEGYEDRMPAELSGGEKKRVAIARVLAAEPSLILYDEPTSGLDPKRAHMIDDIIAGSRADREATSIVVTHDMATCFRVADRVCVLAGGKIVAVGAPAELAAGDNPFAKEFVEESGISRTELDG
jgi:phospholipid/cholesterol/gamma-HCH transport system ATP-binding protein